MAFVTGASSGIGRAVAERLAGNGYAVVGFDRASPSGTSAGVTFVQGDVSAATELTAAIDAAAREHGGIDVLCTCAAIKLADEDADSLEKMLAVNVAGTVHACTAALRHMRAAKRGAIVTLGSGSAHGDAASVGYSASKGAVISLTRSLALKSIPDHVRVNCVIPGLTETGMTLGISPATMATRGERNVTGAANRPEDVANVVAFLVSDDARTMSGAIVHVGAHAGQAIVR